MNLFVFFVLPLATILLSIVLQKILKYPILVALTFFSIYIIASFMTFSDTLVEAIIATIVYTIIAYITAAIVKILKRFFCMNECINNYENNNIQKGRNVNYEKNSDNVEDNIYDINEIGQENAVNIFKDNQVQESVKRRPVALGNNIVNQEMPRRFYRRW